MGRRSTHTQEELRSLIVEAATELIKTAGLAGLSAREIARAIAYSPGTIYNVFKNLDELILVIEGRLLDQLADSLIAVPNNGNPRHRLVAMAETYLKFTHDNPNLWNLLFEHHEQDDRQCPDWYRDKLNGVLAHFENALRDVLKDADADEISRRARVLWSGMHGITSLSTTKKLACVTGDNAAIMVNDLIHTYLDGLSPQNDRQPRT